MIRKIIQIDEDKCNGCGLCASACHEGAIGMVEGKAKLLRDDYCDGLGDCLPACPTGAICFVEREAAAYDEAAVLQNKKKKMQADECRSQLRQWPVQIKLAPVNASYFDGAHLLIAADCTAYAYGNFHNEFIRNRITLIGCPKLDDCDYTEKLTEIIAGNDIKSLTVVRMEVPCCGGIEHAAVNALKNSGRFIPWQVITIRTDGSILER
ncbi:ATP-binding protein [Lachnotalea sp. AF33-28]|uniref:ATP-binding protein n=1 Tax=Lachnotalea sp. AF33-28 TaxID=2292046 RepID=UPI000E46E8FC|nr:4Fe-4S dicluster domain-containing protein [Lachnotalea sp. AF33-28]RHP31711.1 4Fe-4S dicluster domain-containing protein [Lachnotalea sp. AF33-28]